jgi:hypothetical protein
MEIKLANEERENLFPCLGIDGKKHVFVSWEHRTLCGMKIKSRQPYIADAYSCYECDCTVDGRYWGEQIGQKK